MPIAASKAPMVVGMRHTTKATSVGTSVPRLWSGVLSAEIGGHVRLGVEAIGHSGTTTIMKIRVKAVSTKASAISFGVR